MREVNIFLVCILAIAFFVGSSLALASSQAVLVINGINDKPGPVDVVVEGWDVRGNLTIDTILSWDADDNSFSDQTVEIPKTTRILRLTFINDFFIPGNPDTDRNAFIDYFMVNNVLYEAEDFDRTGGIDPVFPGCGVAIIAQTDVADCGNEGDWVEYDLHPGNPVGPSDGPGGRVGPKP